MCCALLSAWKVLLEQNAERWFFLLLYRHVIQVAGAVFAGIAGRKFAVQGDGADAGGNIAQCRVRIVVQEGEKAMLPAAAKGRNPWLRRAVNGNWLRSGLGSFKIFGEIFYPIAGTSAGRKLWAHVLC